MTNDDKGAERRPGELNLRELLRWGWRQLTSMRTAIVLLLLLALAAVPGSVIPQSGVNQQAVTRWQTDHPQLTPIYEKLGLFSVYSSPWFAAVYLLLVISLVGCVVPRLGVYLRAFRAQPPAAPANLSRLPASASYETSASVEDVLAHARAELGRRHRLRKGDTGDAVAAERGQLREAGNLVFHFSVLVVLAGFAMGGLFGFEGGVVIVEGSSFSNNLTQYDDFNPGSLFRTSQLNPFCFKVDDYTDQWLTSGSRAGMAVKFKADVDYQEQCGKSADKKFDLEVNHPLDIGSTEVFLIGHGYAPVITVRNGKGQVIASGPQVFLPQDSTFLSYGVVKPSITKPVQIGLEGVFYPTYASVHGNPVTVFPNDLNPRLAMFVYTGDLGLDSGTGQSVYVLDKSHATQLHQANGMPYRVDLRPGQTVKLPDGLGSVTFNGVRKWVRVQISQTPGKRIALAGVLLALCGLCCSLFIRPRRVWVRARKVTDSHGEGTMERTVVEVAVLDRSGNADVQQILDDLVGRLQKGTS
ncbi:MAG TPA: cytochrome c biogenesis protein ResB [Nocardioides sp.]|nr:cytochrome c biogenesis protein ResB [Nocardioides sp.]